MNLHEVYLAAQIAATEIIKGDGSSKPIDTQVNGESENAVQNKAIYDFVNSSVANNTAYFKGTYNSVSELETIVDATNNDYAFVVSIDIYGNTVYKRYKYSNNEWRFEYALNNSSFTANQWNTINSGITSADIQNLQDGKVDKVAGKGLSTNDFTDADKSKLDGLENYDDSETKATLTYIVNSGAKNILTSSPSMQNLSYSNGVYTVISDTRPALRLKLQYLRTFQDYVGIIRQNITTNGIVSIPFSIQNDLTGGSIRIGHDGEIGDATISFSQELKKGEYVALVDVVSYTTPISFKNIAVIPKELYDISPLYQKPAMDNSELTEKVKLLEDNVNTDVKADISETASQAAINKSTLGYQVKSLIDLGSLSTTTINGITFTNLGDGTYRVNGTATGQITKILTSGITKFLYENITLSGCPDGGNYATGYALYVANSTDTTTIASDTGDGATFKPTSKYTIAIIVRKGTTVDNLIFKPMLRYAEITDDTYEPYKLSVEERLAALEAAVFTEQSMKINNTDTNEEETI